MLTKCSKITAILGSNLHKQFAAPHTCTGGGAQNSEWTFDMIHCYLRLPDLIDPSHWEVRNVIVI